MLLDRITRSARHRILLTALAVGSVQCRSPARDSVDGSAARSSAAASGANAAGAPRASVSASSEQAWAAKQLRELAAGSPADVDAAPATAAPARFLGAFSEAEVRAALGRSGSPKLRVRIAEWPAHPKQLVAVSFDFVPFGGDDARLEPRVTLLEQRDGALSRLAEGRLDRPKVHCTNDNEAGGDDGDERAPDFKLDLAAYRVSASSTPIGVRYTCFHTSTTDDGSEEFLYLLEPAGTGLRQIFSAQIGFARYTRPTFTDSTGVGALSVSAGPAKSGYFDLILRMRVTTSTADPELHPTAPPSGAREESQRFSWDGAHYRPQAAPR